MQVLIDPTHPAEVLRGHCLNYLITVRESLRSAAKGADIWQDAFELDGEWEGERYVATVHIHRPHRVQVDIEGEPCLLLTPCAYEQIENSHWRGELVLALLPSFAQDMQVTTRRIRLHAEGTRQRTHVDA